VKALGRDVEFDTRKIEKLKTIKEEKIE